VKLPDQPFTIADWSRITATTHAGETGHAVWRTEESEGVRVRAVDYSPGYIADHQCDRGHILYVLGGELDAELGDGRTFHLTAGMGFRVSDFGDAAHRVSTRTGGRVCIVD
jgi:hypothetical protein